jgi:hypothetical protein
VTSAVGCSGGLKPSPPTPKSATSTAASRAATSAPAPAQPSNYTGLLILASDINALESAKATRDGYVHGVPEPIAIGMGGTTISGPSPDGTEGVTVLLFTEGKAFAELEFDGPPDVLVPPDFVTDVGQKQDSAIKKGLAG